MQLEKTLVEKTSAEKTSAEKTSAEKTSAEKTMAPLTPKEKTVLEFLELYASLHGFAPTYQEICKHFGFASFNSAQRYLKQLEAKNYISLGGANQKRAISLLQPASSYQNQVSSYQESTTTAAAFQIPMAGRGASWVPPES